MKRNHDIIDIEVQIHHQTDRAILASDDGNKDNAKWLPLSQIEVCSVNKPPYAIVSMPEWLAIEKGLV